MHELCGTLLSLTRLVNPVCFIRRRSAYSDRNVGKDKPVFHTLESENPTFLMTAPAEKPSLNLYLRDHYGSSTQKLVREHERSLHKRACCSNHHIFSMRCRDEGVIPTSLRIRPPVKTREGYRVVEQASRWDARLYNDKRFILASSSP